MLFQTVVLVLGMLQCAKCQEPPRLLDLDLSPQSVLQTFRNAVRLPTFLGGRIDPDSDVRFGQTREPQDVLLDSIPQNQFIGNENIGLRSQFGGNSERTSGAGNIAANPVRLPASIFDLTPTRDTFRRAQKWLQSAILSRNADSAANKQPAFSSPLISTSSSQSSSFPSSSSPFSNHRETFADVDRETSKQQQSPSLSSDASSVDVDDRTQLDVLGALGKLMFQNSKRHP